MNSTVKRCIGIVAVGLALLGFSAGASKAAPPYTNVPFFDAFSYATGTRLLGGTNGNWWASSADVVVTNVPFYGTYGSNVFLPPDTAISNLFNTTSATNVWTDFYVLPIRYAPDDGSDYAADPDATAQFYINSNGYLVVLGAGVTNVVKTNAYGTGLSEIPSNTWKHVSVCHRYVSKTWAIMVDGVSYKEGIPFIKQSGVTNYTKFHVYNGGQTNTSFDEVLITNGVPRALSGDGNTNGMRDAWEIFYFGSSTQTTYTASGDADGDGYINSAESLLWSDPWDTNYPALGSDYAYIPFYDTFESRTLGQIAGQYAWKAAPADQAIVGGPPVFAGSKALGIASGEAYINVDDPTCTSIWTHIVVKPGRMYWNVDIKAGTTVAFYVDTNGWVQALNGDKVGGGTWTKLTNFWALALPGATNNIGPAGPIDSNDWVRFIVKSDYTNDTWSLWMVTNALSLSTDYGKLIARDFGFANAAGSFSQFSMTNLNSGGVTGYVDNIAITRDRSEWVDSDGDTIPDNWEADKGLNENSPATDSNGNNIPDREEWAWGGTNRVGGITQLWDNVSTKSIYLQCLVASNRTYEVWGATTATGALAYVGSWYTGNAGQTSQYEHANAVGQYSKFFYALKSTAGTNVAWETDKFAMYRDVRPKNTWILTSVPVDWRESVGTNTLGSHLGRQLANGLGGGAVGTGDEIYLWDLTSGGWSNFYLYSSYEWRDPSGNVNSNYAITPGHAFWIQRRAVNADTTYVYTNAVWMGWQRTNSTYSVKVNADGWTMLGWPFDLSQTETATPVGWNFMGSGGTSNDVNPNVSDLLWVKQSNGKYKTYMLRTNGRWWDWMNRKYAAEDNLTMQPMNGVFYLRRGAAFNWTATAP